MAILPQQPVMTSPPALAPGREVQRVVRKILRDGRQLDFTFRLATWLDQGMTYVTWELVEGPALDCPCTPESPDDVVSCSACGSLCCVRRHSGTCASCGKVYGSCCLEGIRVHGVKAVVCGSCAKELKASLLHKIGRCVLKFLGK